MPMIILLGKRSWIEEFSLGPCQVFQAKHLQRHANTHIERNTFFLWKRYFKTSHRNRREFLKPYRSFMCGKFTNISWEQAKAHWIKTGQAKTREREREREPLFQKDVDEGPLISSIEPSLDNNLSTIVVKNSAQASGLGHFYESKCKKIIHNVQIHKTAYEYPHTHAHVT